jgi:hypothetical protein
VRKATESPRPGAWFDVTLAFTIAAVLAAVVVPNALRERKAERERVVPGAGSDHYFDTSGTSLIFYTTRTTLVLDTATCVLPNNAEFPNGK